MPPTLNVCLEAGCPELTPHRRCATHSKAKNREWRSTHSHLYSSKKWKATRRRFLSTHLDCECPNYSCPEHHPCRNTPTQVDHTIPHGGDLKLFWDEDNWQALCPSCHSRKTAREVWHS